MPQYIFHACREDGSTESMGPAELPDDAAAFEHAASILNGQPDAHEVVVWCGNRKILTRAATRSSGDFSPSSHRSDPAKTASDEPADVRLTVRERLREAYSMLGGSETIHP